MRSYYVIFVLTLFSSLGFAEKKSPSQKTISVETFLSEQSLTISQLKAEKSFTKRSALFLKQKKSVEELESSLLKRISQKEKGLEQLALSVSELSGYFLLLPSGKTSPLICEKARSSLAFSLSRAEQVGEAELTPIGKLGFLALGALCQNPALEKFVPSKAQ